MYTIRVLSALGATLVVSLGATQAYAQAQWPVARVKPATPAPLDGTPAPGAALKPSLDAKAGEKSPDAGHASGVPQASDAAAAKAPPGQSQWSPQEIEQAQRSCVALLKSVDVIAVGATPMREGECGAPAPIELVSVGKSPQVTFNPPVVVTCEMAAALHKWVTGDLQPLAKKHLGAPLIRIDTMSSYSCRTAYGRARNKLSEHGRANAIDIRAFLTAKAEAAEVLAHWGPTDRDIAAQIAAAKAAAEKHKALAAQQQKANPTESQVPAATAAAPVAVGTLPPAVAETAGQGVTIGIPGAGSAFPTSPSAIGLSNGLPPPNRLGGPKPAAGQPVQAQPITLHAGRAQFLKAAHASACRIFGTVLGPEANEAHRNHFHVDMAQRRSSSFCE